MPDHRIVEQPILRIGVAGFSPAQHGLIQRALARPPALPRWRISPFGEADGWLVNGANIRMMADGILRVAPGLPTEQSVRLNPAEVDRPVAFALPVEAREVEPRCTFTVESVPSIQGTLLRFENWLRHARVLFVLGCDVARFGPQLRHGVFHVNNGGVLLAVLDFRLGRAGVSPRAHPADFQDAQWDRRPASAGAVPESFIATSPAELAWNYARRSEKDDLLPARYLEEPVYFRSAPKVPPRWVTDSQLILLRELAAEPCTFPALQQRTGISDAQMRHDMSCLYFAGAITTTKSKAARATPRHEPAGPQSSGTGLEPVHELRRYSADITAPASFEYRRAASA